MRPFEGQPYDKNKNIQCARGVRSEHPVGSIFKCFQLKDTGRGFYTSMGYMGEPDHVCNPLSTLRKDKRKKILTELYNSGVSINDPLLVEEELSSDEMNIWQGF